MSHVHFESALIVDDTSLVHVGRVWEWLRGLRPAARAGSLREGALFITVSLALSLPLFDLVATLECRTAWSGACSVMVHVHRRNATPRDDAPNEGA